MPNTIYLDYNATTPLDPRVLEVMMPYFHEKFGNSVSAAHRYGWDADKAVELARQQVAELLNCHPHEIYFTAGATESNNWAIRGLIDQLQMTDLTTPLELISSPLEHSSVVNSLRSVEKRTSQVRVHWAQLDQQGVVDLNSVRALMNPRTRLLSFMWINNEVGSINPMQELSQLARTQDCYFHSDATQAIGKVVVDLEKTGVDLLSFSGHKIYGPKGVGVLYLRKQNPKVQIQPLLHGGGHEKGARSGTLNVPAIVGLGKACELTKSLLESDRQKLQKLRNDFWHRLQATFPGCQLNGPELSARAVNNLNVTFKGYQVPASFADLAASKGSACVSGNTNISPVLRCLGLSDEDASKTLRLSLGRTTTESELELATHALKQALKPI